MGNLSRVEREKMHENIVTGSRVFSLTCPLGSLGPELKATLFQPNPRSEALRKDENSEAFKYQKLELVEGEERWEASGHTQGFLLLNWGGTEQNRTVTCMVLKAKAKDRRKKSSP
ncbi:hypothetical protein TNCV_3778191 [Trichonephila clavipes]|nr:hypothetical protein TNCV_3778191 [Trichonephila clavipes]